MTNRFRQRVSDVLSGVLVTLFVMVGCCLLKTDGSNPQVGPQKYQQAIITNTTNHENTNLENTTSFELIDLDDKKRIILKDEAKKLHVSKVYQQGEQIELNREYVRKACDTNNFAIVSKVSGKTSGIILASHYADDETLVINIDICMSEKGCGKTLLLHLITLQFQEFKKTIQKNFNFVKFTLTSVKTAVKFYKDNGFKVIGSMSPNGLTPMVYKKILSY